MKNNLLFLMMCAMVFCCITSCKKDKDKQEEKWMLDNLSALNAIKTNPEYKELTSLGNEGSIYYKVLQAGDGKDTIRYTSAVKCYYKGWYIADYPQYNIKKGDFFDKKLFDDGPPVRFEVSGVVSGWKTALQYMVKGDKWEIWVPYQLGYGRTGDIDQYTRKVTIPGYSTLVFELEVLSVIAIDD
jgi:peptidylprolyl isomerase/FKBP-type peptidyl-prolyl cis-trans isomerase FklB